MPTAGGGRTSLKPSAASQPTRSTLTSSQTDLQGAGKDAGAMALQNYQLGDLLGKGASGSVYRALNFTNGETVAVKQIQLASIPKAELGEIMSEINLLKNLNHPNIVKYKGFVKSSTHLHIILEYCENGSLHSICKRFGRFPEALVSQFIYQTLQGLSYLHEQGVIHRDIKGANILTIKDGRIKLADFGVATINVNLTAEGGDGGRDTSVVGSPYWMAPEIIEQAGASTASDIWSVGCVVIELLSGKPPHYELTPMQALFRIVQDETPPIPPGVSETVKDFLLECFQKDYRLRCSAKRLLKHPWMLSGLKQLESRRLDYQEGVESVQKFNEELEKTSYTPTTRNNNALDNPRARPSSVYVPGSSFPALHPSGPSNAGGLKSTTPSLVDIAAKPTAALSYANVVAAPAVARPLGVMSEDFEEEGDNWDEDFEEGITLSKLTPKPSSGNGPSSDRDEQPQDEPEPWNMRTIMPSRPPSSQTSLTPLRLAQQSTAQTPTSSASPLITAPQPSPPIPTPKFSSLKMARSTSDSPKMFLDGLRSPVVVPRRASDKDVRAAEVATDLRKYSEGAEDYDDIFATPAGRGDSDSSSLNSLKLNSRLSDKSWLVEEGDEEDPFAAIDEVGENDELDPEAARVRDQHARLTAVLKDLIDELQPSLPDFTLRDVCDQLLNIITDVPEMQSQFVVHHGMLAILEVLEAKPSRDVILRLLRIINLIVISDVNLLESLCLIGGIPVVINFTLKQYTPECRLEAAIFISALCNASVQTLQMFISCRGLRVLVELLDEDYKRDKELVIAALGGIGSVFQLQTSTPRNDFCRMFVREGLEDPLSTALANITQDKDEGAEEAKEQILAVFLLFCQISQSDKRVRDALGKRRILKRVITACSSLPQPQFLIVLLRAIKHLSTNPSILDVLQNVNAIEVLAEILGQHMTGAHSTEICNHVLQTLFNLCRLNKSRQEEAAQSGLVPHLKELVLSKSPLKQFALPILLDFASATKGSRSLLWMHDGLRLYLGLAEDDPFWQSSALDSILVWLQEETARVEDVLLEDSSVDQIISCFVKAKAASFENLLEPFLKILRVSSALAVKISKPHFFRRLVDRLGKTSKAVVRLNLLKITRVVIDAHPDPASYIQRFGIFEIVNRLARQDGAVLVRELAKELAREIDISPARPVTPTASKPIVRPKSGPRRSASETSSAASTITRAFPSPPVPPLPKNALLPRRPTQPPNSPGIVSKPPHKRKTSRALADVRWVEGLDGQIKPTTSTPQRK